MMPEFPLLDALAIAVAAAHFGFPLIYYWYAKTRWLPRPWNIRRDSGYTPKVAVILPTYKAAKNIGQRLDNIYEQDYPRGKIEVVVVDDNSPDGTAERVREWREGHGDMRLELIVRPGRYGKLSAVFEGLRNVSRDSEIIILTDDDCVWDMEAVRNVVTYFADPIVGAVTGSIKYVDNGGGQNVYRGFFNVVRLAESKHWSTPIHNGPLLAIRKEVIDMIGLPDFPEADDSAFGSYVAFAGYRAIQVDDVWVHEFSSPALHKRMLRRAYHLITFFLKLKKYARERGIYRRTPFDRVWAAESYLHLINPWLLPASVALLGASLAMGSLFAGALLIAGTALLALRSYRTWVTTQAYLVAAALRKALARGISWER